MSMNSTGRPTAPQETKKAANANEHVTISGNKALYQVEKLIFEIGDTQQTGVDLPEPKKVTSRLGKMARTETIGLAGLSEPQTMRHYVRLSQKNYAIDLGVYPLGSCTMKHNPRLNEKVARMPGFGDVHPLRKDKTYLYQAIPTMDINGKRNMEQRWQKINEMLLDAGTQLNDRMVLDLSLIHI